MSDSTYAILRNPEFRRFLTARFLMMLAVQTQGICVAWQIYNLTKDPLSLGLIGFCSVLPTLTLSLFAGHLTDRLVRKRLLVQAQALTFMSILGLLLLSIGGSQWSLVTQVRCIYALVFLGGIARAFASPTQSAFFAEIISHKDRVQGMAWASSAWQIAAAAGPALGGLLYGFGGAIWAYGCAVILIAISLIAIQGIAPRPIPSARKEVFLDSLLMGLRFVFHEKRMLATISLDLFAVLFGGAVALLPIFAEKLGVGSQGLGIMRAAPFAGASLMALFVAHRPPTKNAGYILLGSVFAYGLCIIGFGLSTNFVLSLFLLMLSGAFDNISVVVRGTLGQLLTPDSMRGRVSAVNQIFIASSNELGEMESGFTAKMMGTVPAVLFGGCMTCLIVSAIAWLSPSLRKLNMNEIGE